MLSTGKNGHNPHLTPPPPSPSETRTAFSEPPPPPVRREPDVRVCSPDNPQHALNPFVVVDTRVDVAGRSTSLAKSFVVARYPRSFGCGLVCRCCRIRKLEGAAFPRPAHAPRHLSLDSSKGTSTRVIGRGNKKTVSQRQLHVESRGGRCYRATGVAERSHLHER